MSYDISVLFQFLKENHIVAGSADFVIIVLLCMCAVMQSK